MAKCEARDRPVHEQGLEEFVTSSSLIENLSDEFHIHGIERYYALELAKSYAEKFVRAWEVFQADRATRQDK